MKLYEIAEWLREEHIVKEKSVSRIAHEQGVSWSTIRYWLIKHKIPIQEYGNKNKQYPNLEPSPTLAYISGVLDGDGGISGDNHIKLGTKDFEFVKALKAIGLKSNVIKNDCWVKNLKRQYRELLCYAYSAVFVDLYNGLTREQKEEIAEKHPEEYLKGFFESAGTYAIRTDGNAHVYFNSFAYELLLMVQRLLTLLGYESKIYESKYRGYFSGREKTGYKLALLGSSVKKYEFIKKLDPVIKNKPYDYSDPSGLRGRRAKNR